MVVYDALLDKFVSQPDPWFVVSEALQVNIAKVCLRGNSDEAFKWLNQLDLIDNEAAAYWREFGLELYSGKKQFTRRQSSSTFDTGANPLFD